MDLLGNVIGVLRLYPVKAFYPNAICCVSSTGG